MTRSRNVYPIERRRGGLEINEAVRLKALEEENRRPKRRVADQALDIQMLKEVNAKEW